MFNPITFKVRDSTGRLVYRQWWSAYLWWPALLVMEVSQWVHPSDTWPVANALFSMIGPLITLWIVSFCITELEDREWIWVMQALAVLLGLVLGSYTYHPDGMHAGFEMWWLSRQPGYVSPEDWITRTRLPAAIAVGVLMIVLAVVERRKFLRRMAAKAAEAEVEPGREPVPPSDSDEQ